MGLLKNNWPLKVISFQIEVFLKEKDGILDRLFDMAADMEEKYGNEEITDLQKDEVDKLRDLFRQKTKMTWNTVMSQELTLVSQTEQVICLPISKLIS